MPTRETQRKGGIARQRQRKGHDRVFPRREVELLRQAVKRADVVKLKFEAEHKYGDALLYFDVEGTMYGRRVLIDLTPDMRTDAKRDRQASKMAYTQAKSMPYLVVAPSDINTLTMAIRVWALKEVR